MMTVLIHYDPPMCTPTSGPLETIRGWGKHVTDIDMDCHMDLYGCFSGVPLEHGENKLPLHAVVVERKPMRRQSYHATVWVWRLGLVHEEGLLWYNKNAGFETQPDWIKVDAVTDNSAMWGEMEFPAFKDLACKELLTHSAHFLYPRLTRIST